MAGIPILVQSFIHTLHFLVIYRYRLFVSFLDLDTIQWYMVKRCPGAVSTFSRMENCDSPVLGVLCIDTRFIGFGFDAVLSVSRSRFESWAPMAQWVAQG